jgi:hypothetical protein
MGLCVSFPIFFGAPARCVILYDSPSFASLASPAARAEVLRVVFQSGNWHGAGRVSTLRVAFQSQQLT